MKKTILIMTFMLLGGKAFANYVCTTTAPIYKGVEFDMREFSDILSATTFRSDVKGVMTYDKGMGLYRVIYREGIEAPNTGYQCVGGYERD